MAAVALEEIARARLGRTLKGKWRLERLIGVGGMAAVYAATHRNGAKVAIKMLHPTVSISETVRARFIREGYLANAVDHPNVVRVLDDDVDESDGCAFLVMDLVVGATLADRGMARLLEEGELLAVAAQTLTVLVAAHEKGIVHRDLKPDNLFVDATGKVWVLDFGIARALEDVTSSGTRTGVAFGTPGFMSPEQALGRKPQIGAATDLYSLGATLFALACGDYLHDAEAPEELVIFTATKQARSLGLLAPRLHPKVVAIIDRATRLAIADRWPSARAMLDAVLEAQAALGVGEVRLLPEPEGLSVRTPLPRPAGHPLHVSTRALAAVVAPPQGEVAPISQRPPALEAPPSEHAPAAPRRWLGVAAIAAGVLVLGTGAVVLGRARSEGAGEPRTPTVDDARPRTPVGARAATTIEGEPAVAASTSAAARPSVSAAPVAPLASAPPSKIRVEGRASGAPSAPSAAPPTVAASASASATKRGDGKKTGEIDVGY
jgi:hypothetical protein